MANSSILGGQRAAQRAAGRDVDSLGPSDSSDSGSDVQGERSMATGPDMADELGAVPSHRDSDSDAQGTGERASASGDEGRDGGDILPDRIEREPGLERGGDSEDALDAADLADVDVEDLVADDEGNPQDTGREEGDGDEDDGPDGEAA